MKVISSIFLAIAVFFSCRPAGAEELKALVFVSNQKDSYDQVAMVKEYAIGETAYSVVMVRGFSRDAKNSMDLSADMRLIGPAGEVIFDKKNHAKFSGGFLDADTAVLDASFDIQFVPGDPVGKYTLEATVHDKIHETQNTAGVEILLFDSPESKKLIMTPIIEQKQLDLVWAEYFRSKNPWAVKRIISALTLLQAADPARVAVGLLVQESLKLNAKQHLEILDIYKEEFPSTPESIKKTLQDIILEVEKTIL